MLLPFTHYHKKELNPVQQAFPYLKRLDFATGFLTFRQKGVTQSILHHLKYKGNYDLGVDMGVLFGNQMKNWLRGYDLIIPVPIHPSRKRTRGYNQSTALAEGVSRVTKIPVEEKIAHRISHAGTQTKKSKTQRWDSISQAYMLKNIEKLESKSVLIIDDVLTTGATIGKLAEMLETADVKRIGIMALATGK